jgi:threonine 3-dehydrogenase
MVGRRHLCNQSSGVGVNRAGAFAEYLSLPMSNVWEHSDGIDLDVASMFDPFGNAVHTALQFPLLGEDVLITGAGPIGCMAAAVCKCAGARHIVVSDLKDERLELACKLGATHTVNVSKNTIEDTVRKLGMSEGFDVGLEMSGAAMAFNGMLANMCHGGKIAMLGIPPEDFSIDWNTVIFNMLTIRGVYGREMYETWYKMSVMIDSGMDISPVITHRLGFADFEEGFTALNAGIAGKVVLNWE